MIIVGTPYGEYPHLTVTDGVGGSPYGPSTLAGTDGSANPSKRTAHRPGNLGSRVARVAG